MPSFPEWPTAKLSYLSNDIPEPEIINNNVIPAVNALQADLAGYKPGRLHKTARNATRKALIESIESLNYAEPGEDGRQAYGRLNGLMETQISELENGSSKSLLSILTRYKHYISEASLYPPGNKRDLACLEVALNQRIEEEKRKISIQALGHGIGLADSAPGGDEHSSLSTMYACLTDLRIILQSDELHRPFLIAKFRKKHLQYLEANSFFEDYADQLSKMKCSSVVSPQEVYAEHDSLYRQLQDRQVACNELTHNLEQNKKTIEQYRAWLGGAEPAAKFMPQHEPFSPSRVPVAEREKYKKRIKTDNLKLNSRLCEGFKKWIEVTGDEVPLGSIAQHPLFPEDLQKLQRKLLGSDLTRDDSRDYLDSLHDIIQELFVIENAFQVEGGWDEFSKIWLDLVQIGRSQRLEDRAADLKAPPRLDNRAKAVFFLQQLSQDGFLKQYYDVCNTDVSQALVANQRCLEALSGLEEKQEILNSESSAVCEQYAIYQREWEERNSQIERVERIQLEKNKASRVIQELRDRTEKLETHNQALSVVDLAADDPLSRSLKTFHDLCPQVDILFFSECYKERLDKVKQDGTAIVGYSLPTLDEGLIGDELNTELTAAKEKWSRAKSKYNETIDQVQEDYFEAQWFGEDGYFEKEVFAKIERHASISANGQSGQSGEADEAVIPTTDKLSRIRVLINDAVGMLNKLKTGQNQYSGLIAEKLQLVEKKIAAWKEKHDEFLLKQKTHEAVSASKKLRDSLSTLPDSGSNTQEAQSDGMFAKFQAQYNKVTKLYDSLKHLRRGSFIAKDDPKADGVIEQSMRLFEQRKNIKELDKITHQLHAFRGEAQCFSVEDITTLYEEFTVCCEEGDRLHVEGNESDYKTKKAAIEQIFFEMAQSSQRGLQGNFPIASLDTLMTSVANVHQWLCIVPGPEGLEGSQAIESVFRLLDALGQVCKVDLSGDAPMQQKNKDYYTRCGRVSSEYRGCHQNMQKVGVLKKRSWFWRILKSIVDTIKRAFSKEKDSAANRQATHAVRHDVSRIGKGICGKSCLFQPSGAQSRVAIPVARQAAAACG